MGEAARIGFTRRAGAWFLPARVQAQAKKQRAKRWTSFARPIGGRSSPSSAGRGHSVPDAQDLTQDFFVMVLKGHLLKRADPDRGRFRSLLAQSAERFSCPMLAIKDRCLKHGGDAQFVSWDEWMAEAPSRLSISAKEAETWPAERIFDVRWAATAAEHALRQLGEECEARGRRRVFDVLSDCLAAERQDVSYQKFSKTLGIPEASVKSLVHELRVRYRDLLRAGSRANRGEAGACG